MATFSLTPAQSVGTVLNFSNKAHRAIFEQATKPLPIDPFDCVHTQLPDFLAALTKRAHDFGWIDRILKIPEELPVQANTLYTNLLEYHATVNIDRLREYELTYVNLQTRERQDMHCLYTCVMDSLSQEGRNKVLTEKEKFTIPSDPANPDSELAYSGNLLLKVVLTKSN